MGIWASEVYKKNSLLDLGIVAWSTLLEYHMPHHTCLFFLLKAVCQPNFSYNRNHEISRRKITENLTTRTTLSIYFQSCKNAPFWKTNSFYEEYLQMAASNTVASEQIIKWSFLMWSLLWTLQISLVVLESKIFDILNFLILSDWFYLQLTRKPFLKSVFLSCKYYTMKYSSKILHNEILLKKWKLQK